MQPRTHYVKGPEGYVAYQVFGSGSHVIVFVPGHPNNIEIMWEDPALSRFLERLATMGRVVCFDKRGTAMLFAATDPERTEALVLGDAFEAAVSRPVRLHLRPPGDRATLM